MEVNVGPLESQHISKYVSQRCGCEDGHVICDHTRLDKIRNDHIYKVQVAHIEEKMR